LGFCQGLLQELLHPRGSAVLAAVMLQLTAVNIDVSLFLRFVMASSVEALSFVCCCVLFASAYGMQ
jgi:threonine/homoserine/homoserine lactone efflux protein